MGIDGEDGEAFFARYNSELERLACGARIAATATRRPAYMTVVDLDGKTIGDLPMSIDPEALDAVLSLIEQSFEEGVQTGRDLERASS